MQLIALQAALAYFIAYGGNWLFGTSMSERPIIVGAVMGLLIGDLPLGVLMGASLEVIFMGSVNIGGQISADPAAATVFAIAFASQQSLNADAALALAIPVGILLGFVTMFVNNIFLTVLVPIIDKSAENGNEKALTIHLNFGVWLLKNIFFALVIYLGVLAGHTAVDAFINDIPQFVMNGLIVAGQLLPAVGISILMKMLWSKEIAAFYFLGFVLLIYLQLPLIAVAAIGLIIAVIMSFIDLKFLELEKKETTKIINSQSNADSELEDFFG